VEHSQNSQDVCNCFNAGHPPRRTRSDSTSGGRSVQQVSKSKSNHPTTIRQLLSLPLSTGDQRLAVTRALDEMTYYKRGKRSPWESILRPLLNGTSFDKYVRFSQALIIRWYRGSRYVNTSKRLHSNNGVSQRVRSTSAVSWRMEFWMTEWPLLSCVPGGNYSYT
jgi:hypothetical protein